MLFSAFTIIYASVFLMEASNIDYKQQFSGNFVWFMCITLQSVSIVIIYEEREAVLEKLNPLLV